MIRTQISLDQYEYKLAKKEAKRRGIALAELFRQALRFVLPVKNEKPWMSYAGFIESGDIHASQHIDDMVYGQKN